MANSEDVVWMACESHLRRFGHVANCAPCLAVTLDYVRAEVRELRVKLDSEAGHRLSLCADNERFVAEVRELRKRKDGAYYERNQVVAALAKCFPSGTARTAIEGWSDDWHGCVYIDLPTGQVSWHYHDSHAHLFADLPPYAGKWDGHDTPEKYRRLAAMAAERGEGEVK